MSGTVYWVLQLQVGDGRDGDLRDLMTRMVKATEADEPGTIDYLWSLSADGRSCHIFGRYRDSAAAMVHIGNFMEKFADQFFDILTPTGFVLYGEPDAAVRDALAGFNPTIMVNADGFRR